MTAFQEIFELVFDVFRTNHNHPDAHIECSEHFFFIDVTEPLHEAEDGQFGPGAAGYFYRDAFGQDAGDVFEKAAAGDVGEAFYEAAV